MELRLLKAAIDKVSAAVRNDSQQVTLDAADVVLITQAASHYHDQRQEEIE